MLLLLSMAISIPVLKAEKADANAVKTVYFTFDDGPSERTEEILDILSEENIKAAGIEKRFVNVELADTLAKIVNHIQTEQ